MTHFGFNQTNHHKLAKQEIDGYSTLIYLLMGCEVVCLGTACLKRDLGNQQKQLNRSIWLLCIYLTNSGIKIVTEETK